MGVGPVGWEVLVARIGGIVVKKNRTIRLLLRLCLVQKNHVIRLNEKLDARS